MPYVTKTLREIFFGHMKDAVRTENGCWEYPKRLDKSGYGIFTRKIPGTRKHKINKAHRVAWELAYGAISPGMCVLHKCDNRKCCNIQHLFLGTVADNIADMIKKGRNSSGKGSSHRTKKYNVVRDNRGRFK